MQKLGVIADSHAVAPRDIDRFKSTFAAPLSASKHEALQVLFSGGFDPVALDLDLHGLDDGAR